MNYIRRGLELGVNFFDTAIAYQSGTSEQYLGRTLRDFARREDVVVATKFLPRTQDEIENGVSGQRHIESMIDTSLQNLGMDYVDLYIYHMWDWQTPIYDIMDGLNRVVRAGKARYVGISNCFAWQIAKANAIAEREGFAKFVSVQGHYNLSFREEEREIVPYCSEENMALTPYSALASGRLSRHPGEGGTKRAEEDSYARFKYEATASLREMIKLWQKQGKTIIAAEHRIAYLWDLVDRALIMSEGRIVKELSGEEKNGLSDAGLAAMGLRGIRQAAPESIELPTVLPGDDAIVLRDFSFSYPGSNGAGKTRFLNCLCGSEKGCRGTLEYGGRLYSARERQKLCFMVMQDTGNQLFTESVLDEVLISLPKGSSDERGRAMDILAGLDLDGFADRHPQSLSGGQKQRLAIACALASERRILLLDEPTSGLDHAHMMQTASLLERLRLMGTTIVVVTHDSELIRACCGRRLSFGRA